MIRSFRNRDTERIFDRQQVRKFKNIARQALRRLEILDAAASLDTLAALPSNRLESLSGDRRGQCSIRINDQYRVCFRWVDGAEDVEIVDYH
ncbi:MAG: type II toxin-antitoxin system RelE/ParE family toxin [Alphaproteobacteria bacterium]|nr:type II toxin-antitoxin system RelE/ParE family toxin [Alphaproteobacteria bacterium]